MGKGQPRLTLVENTKPRRKTAGKPLECDCGSRETYETRVDRRLENGRLTKGQRRLRCAICDKVVL